MLYLAEDSGLSTGVTAGGLGIVALLQVLSFVFRRRGEADPVTEEMKSSIKVIEALAAQTAITTATIETRLANLNGELKGLVTTTTIEYQRALDAINAVNDTAQARLDSVDATVRGNGKEGLTTAVARHDAEIKAIRQRADEAYLEVRRLGTNKDHSQ